MAGDKCTVCEDGLSFMEDGTCKVCNIGDGFYAEVGTNICKKCISNCKGCSNSLMCEICEDGFMLRKDGTCGNCDTN